MIYREYFASWKPWYMETPAVLRWINKYDSVLWGFNSSLANIFCLFFKKKTLQLVLACAFGKKPNISQTHHLNDVDCYLYNVFVAQNFLYILLRLKSGQWNRECLFDRS